MFILLSIIFSSLTNIPSLPDTIIIPEWYSLGPFSVGVREGIIAADDRIETEGYEPDTAAVYPSILVQGGAVRWEKIKSDSGRINIEYKNVAWDTLQDIYGNVGVMNAGYVWASFNCPGSRRAMVWTPEISSFVLNGRSYPADAYGDGYFLIPVILKEGKNRILLKFSGYADHEGSFKILPAPDPLMVVKPDVLLPDLVVGDTGSVLIGVPVMNACDKRLYDIALDVTGEFISSQRAVIKSMIPLSGRKIPVRLELNKEITASDSTPVYLKLTCGDFSSQETCWIKIKKPEEARSRTFISGIDGSCQYYSILPPANFQKDSVYSLLLTLHGAGVEARGQVAAYTQKDWAYVVAPTNRRRFGFDWQDWGRLDALEVLAEAKKNYKIDDDRIYLVGHSMGGHGTWHVGLAHPDLFAAIAPSAGWTTIQLYAPFFLQKSYLFAEPEQLKFREMVMREDVAPLFLENARNLPVYILHGGADDNVPPIQGRLMSKYLNDLGYKYVYDEVPGQGHWWNFDSTPGTDCIDKKEMMDFLRKKVRDPYPGKVVIKTTDLAHLNQAYWVKIDELENIYEDAEISASMYYDFTRVAFSATIPVDKKIILADGVAERPLLKILMITHNITRFTIILPDSIINEFTDPGENNITYYQNYNALFSINGQEIKRWIQKPGEISFYKSGDRFKIGQPKESGLYKSPELYGPIKRAYFSPFLLVYGTRGDSLSTERNLHQARLQSYTWWIRANGYTEVVPDTEVTEELAGRYNLILFGNHETNAYVKAINNQLPVHLIDNRIFIGREKINLDSLCLMEIYPNPRHPDKFVLLYSATNQDMEKYTGLFSTLYSSAGLPDFLVWDKSALNFGWAGVVCAGFFDHNWQLDKNLMYLKK
jgi:predicted esterase